MFTQEPSSQRPSVRSLGLPIPVEGAWLWLAEETERVLAAAREATGLTSPGFTLVRVLERGAEVDYLLGWTDAEGPGVRVIDAGRLPLAAQLINAPEGSVLVAQDGDRPVEGRILFRTHLDVSADGRLGAITTSEGRLERRGDGRWRLLRDPETPPSLRRPPRAA